MQKMRGAKCHYSGPVGERIIAINLFVCLRVCVREHISGIAGPIFTKICLQIPCGRGSVLLWRRCDMLCTSGFVDDVTFDGSAWKARGVAIPGRSLMSMNVLL